MPDLTPRDWKALVRARLASLPLDPARAADVVDELAQHVAEHHAELTASGMDDAAAIEMALRPLAEGDRVALEIARADRPRRVAPEPPPAERGGLILDVVRDVRYAFRVLARTPGFAAVAIVTLALGIGANTTIFSVLNAVLLRPLPFADPGRLVTIGERQPDGEAGNVGYLTFVDWRDRSHDFEEMALIRSFTPTLQLDGQPERVAAMRVSANYFHMLGVRPALGRDFHADEDNPANWHVVVLSDAFWRRRFSADPRVIGRVVSMGDQPFTIVGVLPASFEPLVSEHFYERADLYAPIGYDASLPYACRDCEHLKAIGRLKAGVALETARADIDAVQAALRTQYPTSYSQSTMTLVPLADELNGDIRPVLLVLMGAVALVLVIACANVANLLLARTSERARDLALRTALGAGRWRLVRQLLVESGVIAVSGGALGLLIAAWGVPLLTRLSPVVIPRLDDAHTDGRVLAFSLVLSLGTALAFGLMPALRASRVDLRTTLHAGSSRGATGATSLARRALVAADVALAVVLLAGAGLMIRSVVGLLRVDPGFDPSHALTMQVSLVGKRYAENAATVRTVDRMMAKPQSTARRARGGGREPDSARRQLGSLQRPHRRPNGAQPHGRSVGRALRGDDRLLRRDADSARARTALHRRRPRRVGAGHDRRRAHGPDAVARRRPDRPARQDRRSRRPVDHDRRRRRRRAAQGAGGAAGAADVRRPGSDGGFLL